MNALRRLLRQLLPAPSRAPLEPVRPRVRPHPEREQELQRRRAELDYMPSNGFLVDLISGESK